MVRLTPDTAETQTSEARPLVTGFNAGWHFIDGRDETLYFRTDAGAPFGRIVRFDLREAAPDVRVVRAGIDATRSSTRRWPDGRLLVSSLRNASSRLTTWSLDGGDERAIALPGHRHDQRPRRAMDRRAIVRDVHVVHDAAGDHGVRRRRSGADPARRRCHSIRSSTSPNRCGIRQRTARRSRCSWSANAGHDDRRRSSGRRSRRAASRPACSPDTAASTSA